MEKNYVGELQEIMIKKRITPIYDLIENNSEPHINTFKMSLKCQISPGGTTNIVYGEGISKTAAKHKAALIFLQKYLNKYNNNNDNDKIDNDVSNRMQEPTEFKIDVNSIGRINLLQMICTKNGFKQPEYNEVSRAGPSHSPTFTVACKVGNSRTEGEGSKKAQAKLDATYKMIKFLMEEQNIYEIFESSNPKLSDDNYEIVCFNDNGAEAKAPNPISIFGKKLRGVSPELENASSNSSKDSGKTRIYSRTISEIDKTLKNAENLLYKKLLGTMDQKFSTKKVTILSNEFDVSINHGTRAKITDGINECTDISIRIACLSQLLMDLREYALNKS